MTYASVDAASDNVIVRATIYPAIGIARVGNSDEEWFLGPEVPDPSPEKPGFYRDATGALKRQAARFRIYGLNAAGEAVAELTGDEHTEIAWTVHLANLKAAWYEFQIALDMPEAASAPPSYRRNAQVADRARLVIDSGSRTVQGANHDGVPFDSGHFMGKPVYLGELRTDAAGRLIVLGGRGQSASYNNTRAITFANNDGWYDDMSDGPVTATVRHEGRELTVDPAWVVVAPPNYAPQQKSVRTMWDLMRDLAYQQGFLTAPQRPSFRNDILPIFERLSRLQWVNEGFTKGFGWASPFDFGSPRWIAILADASEENAERRRQLANQFRVFERDSWSPVPWPWIYGDAMNVPAAKTPRQYSELTQTQLTFLEKWAKGDFDADHDPSRTPPRRLEEVPLAGQPATLDQASLEFCLADAFHPGCEMTWPVRTASLYMGPYRFLHAPMGTDPDYGPELTTAICERPDGPLTGQRAGGITRWMAVPWQTDTASCRSGYERNYDPYLPTFWPARVPNQVLTPQDYATVMDDSKPMEDRLAAFARRASWDAALGDGPYVDQINVLANDIDCVAVVEVMPGPTDVPELPPVMEVADRPTQQQAAPPPALLAAASSRPAVDLAGTEKARRFPHGLRG